MRVRIQSAVLLAWLLSATSVHAQKMSADEARTEFRAAQALYQGKRCKDALPRFQRLVDGTGSPNAQLYVARCLRDTAQLAAAYNAYRDAIRSANEKATDEDRYADTRSAAAAERAALESKVSRIVVAAADPPQGFVVYVNERELDLAHDAEAHAVEPGNITVRAEAPGHDRFVKELELAAGARQSVAIVLLRSESPAEADPPDDRGLADTANDTSGPDRTFAYVALGVGAVGLGTFAVAGYLADSRFSELEDTCGGGPCPEAEQDRIDGGRRLDTIANVGLILGGIGLTTGAALWFFGGSEQAPPKTSVAVTPSRAGASIGVSGRF